MIVDLHNVTEVISTLDGSSVWTVDTETTGLRPYHGDKPFSVIIGVGERVFYFNGIEYDGEMFPIVDFSILTDLLTKPRSYIFHNAKFDLSMLANAGLHIPAESKVYCTMTADRVVCGNRLYHRGGFSLGQMAVAYGSEKNDAVEAHILKHGLYEDRAIPGKARKTRFMFYDKVPFNIIVPYGEGDVKATEAIFRGQTDKIIYQDSQRVANQKPRLNVLDNEMKLLRVVWDMEQYGARVDIEYVDKAIAHFTYEKKAMELAFKELTGFDFEPKASLYRKIFAGETWVRTDKGNPSFSGDVLDGFTSPPAKIVNAIRYATHQIATYCGLKYHADSAGVVHANFNQHMAKTGRFSSSSPNLQNLERVDDTKEYTPRRAIIARPGTFLLKLDYNQMEYRMMLDYAGAHGLIAQVNDGLDVHTAMAEAIGIDRSTMKNGNFAMLYGSGDEALSKTIGGTIAQAKELRARINSGSPEIALWISQIKSAVRSRGYVTNWLGRVFYFDRGEEYKACNAVIQGGTADVIKVGMVRIAEYIKHTKTKMILSIHDELVFEIPIGEGYIADGIKEIMENVYEPINGLALTVSAECGANLADKNTFPTSVHKPRAASN